MALRLEQISFPFKINYELGKEYILRGEGEGKAANIHPVWGFVEKCSSPLLLVGGETELILISNELGKPAGGVVSLLDNFFFLS